MKPETFSTPVLFVIFKSPQITARVFERIRAIRPARLYISADGPRQQVRGEERECAATRQVTENIDWECQVFRRYLPENLGCKRAVSSAVSWMFETEEAGIILEYDCLPEISFFNFCSEMLSRYKTDERILHISGDNFQDGISRSDGSYYFSSIANIWGWASWRRAWQDYDPAMVHFAEFKRSKLLEKMFSSPHCRQYWLKKFEEVYQGINKTTWGFIWVFAVMNKGGLCVAPDVNMISNIGFWHGATHARDASSPLANISTRSMPVVEQPSKIVRCVAADEYLTDKLCRVEKAIKPGILRRALPVLSKFVPKQIKTMIKRLGT